MKRGMPSYRHRDKAIQFASALLEAQHADRCQANDLIPNGKGGYKFDECDCGLDDMQKEAQEYLRLFGREVRSYAMNTGFRKIYGGKKS
jgi:hypothetical protein